jgi:hypothetical protein
VVTILAFSRAALRAVRRGAVAAALAGVASAAVTRVLMRAVALLTSEPTNFSVGGSAGIALIYTVALLPGCIALAFSSRWWPWLVLAAGAALLLFEAVAIGVEETAAATDMTAPRSVGLGIVLLGMAATYALQIRTAAHLSRRGLGATRDVDPGPVTAPKVVNRSGESQRQAL